MSTELPRTEKAKRKKNEKEQNIREWWDNYKQYVIYAIIMPEGEERQ